MIRSKPVPGIGVYSLSDNFQTGFASFGTTDAAGTVSTLPYRRVSTGESVPSHGSRVATFGPKTVPWTWCRAATNSGMMSCSDPVVNCRSRQSTPDTNKPVSDAFFWQIPSTIRRSVETITVSTFAYRRAMDRTPPE